ncbi:hypothetical protein Rsub_06601 [Raphidocelis subcapitata]|uniref:Uncharacterized protein n=1 Tax=Raphidocelis subcapitata TaxID=307507 RepID=A0A2V0P0S7_9CHLO|nr:hypothetical protein Rsub_06601 [Raphidocelis subcapitata]|eukprot:GBF93468.1 hypothetical protein Rsub_06601 [Raphidocelis subcapitata]
MGPELWLARQLICATGNTDFAAGVIRWNSGEVNPAAVPAVLAAISRDGKAAHAAWRSAGGRGSHLLAGVDAAAMLEAVRDGAVIPVSDSAAASLLALRDRHARLARAAADAAAERAHRCPLPAWQQAPGAAGRGGGCKRRRGEPLGFATEGAAEAAAEAVRIELLTIGGAMAGIKRGAGDPGPFDTPMSDGWDVGAPSRAGGRPVKGGRRVARAFGKASRSGGGRPGGPPRAGAPKAHRARLGAAAGPSPLGGGGPPGSGGRVAGAGAPLAARGGGVGKPRHAVRRALHMASYRQSTGGQNLTGQQQPRRELRAPLLEQRRLLRRRWQLQLWQRRAARPWRAQPQPRPQAETKAEAEEVMQLQGAVPEQRVEERQLQTGPQQAEEQRHARQAAIEAAGQDSAGAGGSGGASGSGGGAGGGEPSASPAPAEAGPGGGARLVTGGGAGGGGDEALVFALRDAVRHSATHSRGGTSAQASLRLRLLAARGAAAQARRR